MSATPGTDYSAVLPSLLVEQTSDAIIFADKGGTIRLWNHGAERIFGHAAADVIGGSLDIIIPEKLLAAHNTGFGNAMSSGTMKYVNKVLTTRSMRKDGATIYVDMSFDMIRDAAGNILGALAIARDSTERYTAERAQRVRISELEKAAADKA
ncbi:MAG TPA: PAS domain S-box protein [Oxalicibacterium sp.]|jgi:PAS domain S-box-containing protein|nr:PAS domain S-box protein [Oxalicibacterium sp.]